jgi:hypothetical protein
MYPIKHTISTKKNPLSNRKATANAIIIGDVKA